MLDEGMDIPPLWFGAQIVIADSEGIIPIHERELFVHFCSQECLSEYAKGDILQERAALIEQEESDLEEENDLEEEEDVP